MPWAPERGDVIWITMNPSVGHGQAEAHPPGHYPACGTGRYDVTSYLEV